METSQRLNESKNFHRADFRKRIIAGVIVLVVFAFFGSLRLMKCYGIDPGQWLGRCGFQQSYGLPCPTCGMTTAVFAFAGGRFIEAFYIQPAGGLLCCILVVSAFLAFIVAVFGVYFRFLDKFFSEIKVKYIILALAVIIAAGWAVTLARAFAARSRF